MMKKIFLFSALSAFAGFASAQSKYVGWSTGYYTNWSSQPVTAISWKDFTHVCYFAMTPSASGGLGGVSAAEAKAFVAEAHKNGVKAIICVGGDGTDGNFNSATSNAGSQTTLVKNIVAFQRSNGFDGVDMDWESKSESAGRVTQFYNFHKELRDSLNNVTPHPLLTAAIADWYPKCSASLLPLCDQLNAMSYWSLVGAMDGFMSPILKQNVPKSHLGVGMGFDTDGEVDVNNPTDCVAKCKYALANGYGGIMIWEIMRSNAAINDGIAPYVTHETTGLRFAGTPRNRGASITINTSIAGLAHGATYGIPEFQGANGSLVNLAIYDLKGALVKNLSPISLQGDASK